MQRYHRQSRRLPGWDYSTQGWYFLTCVTWDRRPILAEIQGGCLRPTAAGCVSERAWRTIPDHFPGVTLDAFVVMPDHVHGLIHLDDRGYGATDAGATHGSPLPGSPRLRPRSLGAIVAGWKSAATKGIWRECPELPRRIWQRNYHEWVVRDDRWLERIRDYIAQNPAKWVAKSQS